MKKKNITLLVCLVASIVAAVALYLGTGGVKSDMPPSLPNIGGSQFAGSTQVIQINNTNGFHSSLIKPVCRGRYVKSLELLKSPLYVSAFGVNQASSVSDFLSKVSPDNDHYVMLLFNNITQSYVELGSNMFGSLPRIGVEEFDTYTIGSNQMVYFFTNSVNKFCFESDNRVFEPIKDVNGWSLVQLYTSQFVPNVRSAYKFNQESKPEKVTETLYKPGFYWFAFDYSDFSEDFGDEGVAVSPFGSFSDKSIYLRNDQNENVSLGVFDVLSKEMVDTLSFQVRSQTQEEFLSVVNSIELLINSESFVLAPPSTLSENSLFAIELTQAMQAALMESQQVEIILNLKAVESNQLVDLGVVFESGENKSDLLDLLNVDIYLSDLSVVMADAASDLELINGLKVSNLDYANLEFSVDGDVNVEFLTLKLSEESTVDSSNYLAIDFVVDAETIFTHRFTNDAKEISLSSAVIDQILAEGGKTLQLHTNVDLLTEQSDLELVLETKIANAEDAIEIALPQILVADYLQIEQSDYYTFSETCLLDSNIYYSATFLEELSNRFESVYDGFFGDFTTLDSLSVGLSITPYVDINDITFSYTVSGSEPVSVLQADGFTTLFEFALNDNKAPIVNFSSESYSEEFTELFNSKRLLSLDKLELSTENLALRFNLGSTNQEGDFEKIEHRCESRPDYALNVDELLFDSKIFVSDLSEFVKLNFTNLVLGKNFFVKIDWHESLMALLDLNSNPLITSLSSQDDVTMVFGFENRDLEEFDFILDQLLADLGTDDAPISEQELEDLIESNPISLTV